MHLLPHPLGFLAAGMGLLGSAFFQTELVPDVEPLPLEDFLKGSAFPALPEHGQRSDDGRVVLFPDPFVEAYLGPDPLNQTEENTHPFPPKL